MEEKDLILQELIALLNKGKLFVSTFDSACCVQINFRKTVQNTRMLLNQYIEAPISFGNPSMDAVDLFKLLSKIRDELK